jgi:tetratricopeptide (TPR) repeat protein
MLALRRYFNKSHSEQHAEGQPNGIIQHEERRSQQERKENDTFYSERETVTMSMNSECTDDETRELLSLIQNIRLDGPKHEPKELDDVVHKIRNLGIQGEDGKMRLLANLMVNFNINESGTSESREGGLPTVRVSESSESQMNQSPLKENDLQKTWSGETSSTSYSQLETKESSMQSSSISNSSSPSSLDTSNFSDVGEAGRGRSPSRTTKINDTPKQHDVPDVHQPGRGSRPPTSDNNQKSSASNSTRRSPSPFRGISNIFGRKKKDPQSDGGTPASIRKARSFDRSSGTPGTTPKHKPPMSPFPPSSDSASFTSSLPPTPSFSILGLARDTDEDGVATKGMCTDFSSFHDFGGKQSSSPAPNRHTMAESAHDKPLSSSDVPGHSRKNNSETLPRDEGKGSDQTAANTSFSHTKDQNFLSPDQRGRGRARTPSRSNPRVQRPSQHRSRSVPRTTHSDKARSSAFRQYSPARLFARRGSVAEEESAFRPKSPSPMEAEDLPPFEKSQPVKFEGAEAPSAASNMPNEPQKEAKVPASSPLKTPAPPSMPNDNDFATGKHKQRRKMPDPLEASPNTITDDSFCSMEGNGAQHSFPSIFQVDLSNPANKVKQNKARGKRTTGRKNKTHPRMPEPPQEDIKPQKSPGGMRAFVDVHTPMVGEATHGIPDRDKTVGAGPSIGSQLSPMDMDSYPDNENQGDGASAGLNPAKTMAENNILFSLGDMGSKHERRQSKRGSRMRGNRPNASVKNMASTAGTSVPVQQGQRAFGIGVDTAAAAVPPVQQPYPVQADIDYTRILDRINSIREEARRFYISKDYRASIKWFTKAIQLHATLGSGVAHGDLLAVLLSNRAAALLMIRAVDASVSDCKKALNHVSELSAPHYALANDSGPVLKAKLYTRMARALLKAGDAQGADLHFNNAIDTAEKAKFFCEQVHNPSEGSRDKKIFDQIITDSTLGKADASQFQRVMDNISKLPDLQAVRASLTDRRVYVEALGQVDLALSTAPTCVGLHEKKMVILASLRRWREIASHCERLAAVSVQLDDVFTEDLYASRPYPDIPPAKVLSANFFGDPREDEFKAMDYKSAELKLNSKAAAEAILRLPPSLTAFYLRSLRLEERYPVADAAIKALDQYVKSKVGSSEYNRIFMEFSWLQIEANKLNQTKRGRERGDELFRSGEFELASAEYASCLKIDSEGNADNSSNAGGRLHAVLHCNRAACLMALRRFDDAVQECTLALRIHSRYMKAMLRRGRCYSRLERYEESVAEYKRWLELVEDAKRSPGSCAAFMTPCLFDGPRNVSHEDINQVKAELEEAQKMKERKENAAREEASFRHERQRFHEHFSDAQRRRDHWFNQQGAGASRRWDSFNEGFGTRRSPKQKNNQSNRSSDSRRSFQNDNNNSSNSENTINAFSTHYGVLQVSQNATEADIKKAYRKVSCSNISFTFQLNKLVVLTAVLFASRMALFQMALKYHPGKQLNYRFSLFLLNNLPALTPVCFCLTKQTKTKIQKHPICSGA